MQNIINFGDRLSIYQSVVNTLKGGGHGHFSMCFLVSIVSLDGAEVKYHAYLKNLKL